MGPSVHLTTLSALFLIPAILLCGIYRFTPRSGIPFTTVLRTELRIPSLHCSESTLVPTYHHPYILSSSSSSSLLIPFAFDPSFFRTHRILSPPNRSLHVPFFFTASLNARFHTVRYASRIPKYPTAHPHSSSTGAISIIFLTLLLSNHSYDLFLFLFFSLFLPTHLIRSLFPHIPFHRANMYISYKLTRPYHFPSMFATFMTLTDVTFCTFRTFNDKYYEKKVTNE